MASSTALRPLGCDASLIFTIILIVLLPYLRRTSSRITPSPGSILLSRQARPIVPNMALQEPVDMSAAWLAHAPPPPPTTAVRKPRRSSSYEPLSAHNGSTMNDMHTRGGYLPPSSHSPEPPSSRRSSVSDLKELTSSSSAPASSVKRVRSKVTSNPVPPAPSAFYNYQHQLQQQQQQQQQLYHQSQHPVLPTQQLPYAVAPDAVHAPAQLPMTSAVMAHSCSDNNASPSYPGYSRERRDSAPIISYSQQPHSTIYAQQHLPANSVSPVHPTVYDSVVAAASAPAPVTTSPYSAAQPPLSAVPASHLQYMPPLHSPIPPHVPHYGVPPQQQHQPWAPTPQSQPVYQQAPAHFQYPAVTPPGVQQPWDQPGATVPSSQQPEITFPASAGAPPSMIPSNTHVSPTMQISSPPISATSPRPGHATDLSRQSTTSSVASVRRPLPQPSRTSSNPSAPGSPVTSPIGLTNRASVRRDLPRPPSGSSATISTASAYMASNLARTDPGSPGSPIAGTTSRLPASALNRTESVRLAAEALMARGVPQRRPLRSALASTTFSPPLPPTRMAASPSVHTRELPASQSEPVAATTGTRTRIAEQHPTESPSVAVQATHRSSQSTGSVLSHSIDSSPVRPRALPEPAAAPALQHSVTTAPAPPQNAVQPSLASDASHVHAQPSQPSRRHEPARYQETAQLVDSLASMSVGNANPSQAAACSTSAPSVPVFSFEAPDEEPEKPRRRRGSSVSRAGPPPGQKAIQQAVTAPTIVLPGGDGDDGGHAAGPSIQICGADDERACSSSGPMVSVTADDDDVRSQTSNASKGPSISVSFSAEPSAKSQRAGTSHAPSSGAATAMGSATNGRVSASSVGSGAGCHGCRKWIAGKVVHALGTTYHPGCFVCAHCSEGLEHVAFYEHQGLPYCHFDYHELFSKRCFHCRTPIVDERYISVQDEELTGQDGETAERCYHELHFFCANCGDPFLDPKAAGSAAGSDPGLMTADENGKVKHGGMEFIVHKGYPYCEKCHVNLHKPRCNGCKKPVLGDLISALRAKWHPECFTCCSCDKPFEDTMFFVKDGRPYDEACYKVLLRNMI